MAIKGPGQLQRSGDDSDGGFEGLRGRRRDSE
jgi:hypothetical protein